MLTALPAEIVYGVVSGLFVGFTLGVVGGGGSVLAVPLLVYFVGVPNPHEAIGSSAAAVAVNALLNLAHHARSGAIKWRCATVFAAFGVGGAYVGSTLGKIMDGQKLLALFAALMIVVATLMLRGRGEQGFESARLSRETFPRLAAAGLTTGALSGFFGVGGGFLIVPGLMFATDMPIINAIGSSLIAVCAFAVTTAANYASSDFVDWELAGALVIGGALGGLGGAAAARRLSKMRGALSSVFAGVILLVALYMLWRSGAALGLIDHIGAKSA